MSSASFFPCVSTLLIGPHVPPNQHFFLRCLSPLNRVFGEFTPSRKQSSDNFFVCYSQCIRIWPLSAFLAICQCFQMFWAKGAKKNMLGVQLCSACQTSVGIHRNKLYTLLEPFSSLGKKQGMSQEMFPDWIWYRSLLPFSWCLMIVGRCW